MNKKNKGNEESINPFEQFKEDNKSLVDSSSNLNRFIDMEIGKGEVTRKKYFSNKIRLRSHTDLVRMAKLEERSLATILERAIECYKEHHHPNLK